MANEKDKDSAEALPPDLPGFEERKSVETVTAEPLTKARLQALLSERLSKPVMLGPPVLELTARSPWGSLGWLVMYDPFAWDPSPDRVFMISYTKKPFTEGHIRFTPSSSGRYLISVQFAAKGASMYLLQDQKTSSAYSQDYNTAAVSTDFTANAGVTTVFRLFCSSKDLVQFFNAEVYAL